MKKTSRILIPFEDKWVALTNNRTKVLASGATIKELEEKLKGKEEQKEAITLTKVFRFDGSISP